MLGIKARSASDPAPILREAGIYKSCAVPRRQVELLEGVVAGLKRRMAHDEALRKADHTRLLQVRRPSL